MQEKVYDKFVADFTSAYGAMVVGNGLEKETQMGPLANERRIPTIEAMVNDAREKGAEITTGGERIGNVGNFYKPTVIAGAPLDSKIMNEEPFGPVAVINRFKDFDEVVEEANRLPYGLASYAYTGSAQTAQKLGMQVEAGMTSINHIGLALPEVPFGGIKDSGYGSEGGSEAVEPYLVQKFVTTLA